METKEKKGQVKKPEIKKKIIDVTKPLSNVRHEKLARALAKNGMNQTQAYKEVYDPAGKTKTPNKGAYDVLSTKPYIKERAIAILNQNEKTSLKYLLSNKLSQLVDQQEPIVTKDGIIGYKDNAPIQLETTKTLLSMHGVLKQQENVNNTQINISSADADTLNKLAKNLETLNNTLSLSPIHQGKIIDI